MSDVNARYENLIVDLHARWRTQLAPHVDLELFCSVRNLFNGNLYYADIYPNPRRWAEGGVSLSF